MLFDSFLYFIKSRVSFHGGAFTHPYRLLHFTQDDNDDDDDSFSQSGMAGESTSGVIHKALKKKVAQWSCIHDMIPHDQDTLVGPKIFSTLLIHEL